MTKYNILIYSNTPKKIEKFINVINSYGINSVITVKSTTEECLVFMNKEKVDIFFCTYAGDSESLLREIYDTKPDILSVLLINIKDMSKVVGLIKENLIYHFIVSPYNDGYVREVLRQTIMQLDSSFKIGMAEAKQENLDVYREKYLQMNSPELNAFMSFLEVTRKDIFVHSVMVGELSSKIAARLGMTEEEIRNVKMAGFLQDIGKVAVRDSILNKPGKLETVETNEMQNHPKVSYDILMKLEGMENIARIVYEHHEKLDGSGYPQGLSGNDIRRHSRILCVADTFVALTSDRIYRRGLEIEKAREVLRKDIRKYDPRIIDVLVSMSDEEIAIK